LKEALLPSTRDGYSRNFKSASRRFIISKVNTMIVLTNQKLLSDRSSLQVNQSKIIVPLLVIAGPLMVAILAS
jgi:hypothetical protein